MFERIKQRVAQWLVPAPPTKIRTRMYHAAKVSRLTQGWGQSNTSEDSELSSSLRILRSRSRELCRDSAYAKRAKVIVQNNVIGAGIGMQAKVMTSRHALNDRVNDSIETAWARWSRATSCHTGQSLHFCDLERAMVGQVFEAGEIFIRTRYQAFGNSDVPYVLELIEPERLADEFQPSPQEQNAGVRLGIETDVFHAPLAYWIRTVHPGELRLTAAQTSRVERVPADQIIHLRLIDRWPQTRGVPWLHAAARRLNDMDGLGEAEITAARAAACYMGFIESPAGESPQYGDTQADGSEVADFTPAMVERLKQGEHFNFAAPNRPNAQLDPFMRLMLREVAAGVGVSYESLSRDYSQSNYSSSRLGLLDDRDLWRVLQMWIIRSFREVVHRRWLQQAVLARAIPAISLDEYAQTPAKFEEVRFKPRGWSWIDPTKEVEAFKEAIRCGFTTQTDVIAQTAAGRDFEDTLKERKQELEMAASMGLAFESDPAFVPPAPESASVPEPPEDEAEPPERRLSIAK